MQAPSQHSTCAGSQRGRVAQLLQRGLDDAAGQPAPAGMGRAHRARRGQQHRQAIGHLHRAGEARLGGDAGIGLMQG